MSSFQSALLVDKLNKLNSTQQSIETLSCYCIFHLKHAKEIVRLWDKQFAAVNLPRKLSLLYLCNDIMQKARKKVGTNYANEFFKILPGALRHVRKHSDAAGAAKLDRLVGVWGERGVYSASAIQTIRKAIAEGAAQSTAGAKPADSKALATEAPTFNNRGAKSSTGMVSEKVQQLNALVLSVTELQGEARGDKSMQYNLAKTSVEFNTALTPAQKAAFRPAVVAYHEVIRKQLDQRQALLGSLEEMVQEQQTALTQCKSELESVEALKAKLPEESKLEGAAVAPASIESTPASMPDATEDTENETNTTEVVAKLEAAVDNGDAAKLLASIMSVLPSIKPSEVEAPGDEPYDPTEAGAEEPPQKKTRLEQTADLDI